MSSMPDALRRSFGLAVMLCLVVHFLADGLAACLTTARAQGGDPVRCVAATLPGRLAAGEPHGDVALAAGPAPSRPVAPSFSVTVPAPSARAGYPQLPLRPPKSLPTA